MTEQEALKIIGSLQLKCKVATEYEAFTVAIIALNMRTLGKLYHGGQCPCCGQVYSTKPIQQTTYCWVCGQALDWSD